MSIANIILLSANIPIFVVAIYAAYHYKKLNRKLRIFSSFLFLSALIQLPSVCMYYFSVNNMPLLHIYTGLGGFILIHFYRAILSKYLSEQILKYLAIAFLVFSVVNVLFFQDINTFNTNVLTVQAVIIVTLSLSSFNLLLQESSLSENKSSLSTLMWINSGFFIYFSSSLLLYYFGDHLMKEYITFSSFRNVWTLHSLFSNVMYSFFFIGLWKQVKQ